MSAMHKHIRVKILLSEHTNFVLCPKDYVKDRWKKRPLDEQKRLAADDIANLFNEKLIVCSVCFIVIFIHLKMASSLIL
jgi:hypothetical protein